MQGMLFINISEIIHSRSKVVPKNVSQGCHKVKRFFSKKYKNYIPLHKIKKKYLL